jgi:hypothetical protein
MSKQQTQKPPAQTHGWSGLGWAGGRLYLAQQTSQEDEECVRWLCRRCFANCLLIRIVSKVYWWTTLTFLSPSGDYQRIKRAIPTVPSLEHIWTSPYFHLYIISHSQILRSHPTAKIDCGNRLFTGYPFPRSLPTVTQDSNQFHNTSATTRRLTCVEQSRFEVQHSNSNSSNRDTWISCQLFTCHGEDLLNVVLGDPSFC